MLCLRLQYFHLGRIGNCMQLGVARRTARTSSSNSLPLVDILTLAQTRKAKRKAVSRMQLQYDAAVTHGMF
jgi:hypothetical protein